MKPQALFDFIDQVLDPKFEENTGTTLSADEKAAIGELKKTNSSFENTYGREHDHAPKIFDDFDGFIKSPSFKSLADKFYTDSADDKLARKNLEAEALEISSATLIADAQGRLIPPMPKKNELLPLPNDHNPAASAPSFKPSEPPAGLANQLLANALASLPPKAETPAVPTKKNTVEPAKITKNDSRLTMPAKNALPVDEEVKRAQDAVANAPAKPESFSIETAEALLTDHLANDEIVLQKVARDLGLQDKYKFKDDQAFSVGTKDSKNLIAALRDGNEKKIAKALDRAYNNADVHLKVHDNFLVDIEERIAEARTKKAGVDGQSQDEQFQAIRKALAQHGIVSPTVEREAKGGKVEYMLASSLDRMQKAVDAAKGKGELLDEDIQRDLRKALEGTFQPGFTPVLPAHIAHGGKKAPKEVSQN